VVSEYTPAGDQPKAIEALARGVREGLKHQTLLGVTGSGKTFTLVKVLEKVQRPALVIAHNKTLAAQLYSEFKSFLPENAVGYFVSYYDFYQPEAYIARSDTYIDKQVNLNEDLERLRHLATMAASTRRDFVIVASVSCIYGLGSPEEYRHASLKLSPGEQLDRDELAARLVEMEYVATQFDLVPGTFRLRGDVVDIRPAYAEEVTRLLFWGDELEEIQQVHPVTGEVLEKLDEAWLFPATHYVTVREKIESVIEQIEAELEERLQWFLEHDKHLEAQRLKERTRYDMEMLRATGTCRGIENYARYFDGRKPGEPPFTLFDYLPDDVLTIIDESHQTLPQLAGMYNGDRRRKEELVKYGFRLPSAFDNRPLTFEEFEARVGQVIYVSATPGPYELAHSQQVVEQLVRPTGLLDPEIEVRPIKGQLEDLLQEVKARTAKNQRVLVTTLTKRMAEELAEYLSELGLRVTYLHSEIKTLERPEILNSLRRGEFDVLVGVNLLREGLDLPEVSLVAILDADKEGFLRSYTSLIQTMGRAARHVEGKVIMYADMMTDSLQRAIKETRRRRKVQEEYNRKHNITPRTISKPVRASLAPPVEVGADESLADLFAEEAKLPLEEARELAAKLESQMKAAAKALEFEQAPPQGPVARAGSRLRTGPASRGAQESQVSHQAPQVRWDGR